MRRERLLDTISATMPGACDKRLHTVAFRVTDPELEYLQELATAMKLPTDQQPVLSRACQIVVSHARTTLTGEIDPSQPKPCQRSLQGKRAMRRLA